MKKQSGPTIAPVGAIWVCTACGKTTRDRYGIDESSAIGWDASCMLNSILCRDDETLVKKGSRVTSCEPLEGAK